MPHVCHRSPEQAARLRHGGPQLGAEADCDGAAIAAGGGAGGGGGCCWCAWLHHRDGAGAGRLLLCRDDRHGGGDRLRQRPSGEVHKLPAVPTAYGPAAAGDLQADRYLQAEGEPGRSRAACPCKRSIGPFDRHLRGLPRVLIAVRPVLLSSAPVSGAPRPAGRAKPGTLSPVHGGVASPGAHVCPSALGVQGRSRDRQQPRRIKT